MYTYINKKTSSSVLSETFESILLACSLTHTHTHTNTDAKADICQHIKMQISHVHFQMHGRKHILRLVSGHRWITVTGTVVDRADCRHVWPLNWLQSHWSETLLQQPLQPRSISANTTPHVYTPVRARTWARMCLQRRIVLMWYFIKPKNPESVVLYVAFVWHPLFICKTYDSSRCCF